MFRGLVFQRHWIKSLKALASQVWFSLEEAYALEPGFIVLFKCFIDWITAFKATPFFSIWSKTFTFKYLDRCVNFCASAIGRSIGSNFVYFCVGFLVKGFIGYWVYYLLFICYYIRVVRERQRFVVRCTKLKLLQGTLTTLLGLPINYPGIFC